MHIAQCLKTNINFTDLYLRNLFIFYYNIHKTILILGDNRITTKGVNMLCEVLTIHNTSIHCIDLCNYSIYLSIHYIAYNKLSDGGLNMISKMIKVHPLHELNIGNKLIIYIYIYLFI